MAARKLPFTTVSSGSILVVKTGQLAQPNHNQPLVKLVPTYGVKHHADFYKIVIACGMWLARKTVSNIK
jgi:hypothetical protein